MGIIDVQEILGAGWYLVNDQSHYTTGIPSDIVEGGQLLAIYNPSDNYSSMATNTSSALTSKTSIGKLHVSVTPNPGYANVKAFISGAKNGIILILTDMNGKPLWQSGYTRSNIISIPAEKFSKGIYMINVQSGQEKASVKLIIAK